MLILCSISSYNVSRRDRMEEIIKEIISEYKKLDEVEAITLAGSRAAGRND